MRVCDLIEILKRSPQDNTLIIEMKTDVENHIAEMADEPPIYSIDDVLVGKGTLRGLTYIEIADADEWEE